MNKVKSLILKTDYKKFFLRFIIVSLILLILGAVLVGLAFRTQISESISYAQHGGQGEYGFHDHDDLFDWDWIDDMPLTRPSTGALVILGVFGLLCLLILVVYWLAVAAWLYKAAVGAGMNHLIWPLAGLLCNLCAVVAFLVIRSITRQKCTSCGHWQRKRAVYCENCGAKQQMNCPYCGASIQVGASYCPSCGKKLPDAGSQGADTAESASQADETKHA